MRIKALANARRDCAPEVPQALTKDLDPYIGHYLLTFSKRVLRAFRRANRFDRINDDHFHPILARRLVLAIVNLKDSRRRIAGQPRLLSRIGLLRFRRARRNFRAFRQDLCTNLLARGSVRCQDRFLVVHLRSVFAIGPRSFRMVRFNAHLTTLHGVGRLGRLIRQRSFLFHSKVPSRRHRRVRRNLKRVATFAVAQEGLATLKIVPFRKRSERTRTVAIALARLALTIQFRRRKRVNGRERHVDPARHAMRRRIRQDQERPFFATGRVDRLRRVIICGVNRVMDKRFVHALVGRLIVRSKEVGRRVATGRIICVRVLTQFCLRASRVLVSFIRRAFRFLFARKWKITRRTAYEDVMLRVEGLLAFNVRFLQYIGYGVYLTNVRGLLSVFLVCITSLQLAMESVLTSRARAFVRQSTRPPRELRSVLFYAQRGATKVNVLCARSGLSTVLTNGGMIMWDYTSTASVWDSNEAKDRAGSCLSLYRDGVYRFCTGVLLFVRARHVFLMFSPCMCRTVGV